MQCIDHNSVLLLSTQKYKIRFQFVMLGSTLVVTQGFAADNICLMLNATQVRQQ